MTHEPVWVKWLLVTVGLGWFAALLLLPLATVFIQALSPGLAFFWHAISEPDALSALGLTALVTLCSVPLNLLFGLAAAWAIARFRFPGRQLLITLIDLPFSVSPVIAGLMFVLLFGSRGWFGEWLSEHDIKIIFATRGSSWRPPSSLCPSWYASCCPRWRRGARRKRRPPSCWGRAGCRCSGG